MSVYDISNYQPLPVKDSNHSQNNDELQSIIQKLNSALTDANKRIEALEKKVGA